MKHIGPCAILRGATALTLPRGIVQRGIRADGTDPKALLEELNKAWATFKTNHDEQIKEIKSGIADVVKTEKVDRINNTITDIQGQIDDLLKKVAAMKLNGGGPTSELTPERKAHAAAFSKYFRKGVEADLRDLEVKAALATDSDPDGGYTVPFEMEQTLDRILGTVSAMRQLATVRQIGTSTFKKPVNQGGSTSGWVGERESRPETSTPTIALLEFPAMELYAAPKATQSMLDDSFLNVESWLGDEVSIEFAEEEGAAFVSGNGVNKPRGFLSYDTVADASYAWGKIGFIVTGEAADFVAEDPVDPFINLVYALKQGYRSNATWIMNRTNQGKVRKFKDDQDNYMWTPPFQGGVQTGQPAQFLGYPIVDDDNMPAVGANAFPVAFGDFRRGYLIVDRVGVRVLRDPYTSKPYVIFYTTKRVGGGVQNFEAIKLLKCST